ncbi:MAG: LAGLIDADG family homing endonuclease, partial [Gemmatimonadaceae bacterium]
RRKRGEEPVTYRLPELRDILEPTYGVITYQEQVMRIAQTLAGISLAEADVLRKAVGKKDAELIREELGKFVEKAVARGYDRSIIEEISGQLETFGRYGFNKCLPGHAEILDGATGRLVRIEDLYNGTAKIDNVVTCDPASLKLQSGLVANVMDNGIKPVYRLRTESGREIEATANHPFLTFDGWRELGDLAIGGHIAVPRSLPVEGTVEWPEHEVIALGHLLAEGNLCHPSGVYFYNQDSAQVGDFITAAEQFSNVACSTKPHKGTDSVYTRRINRTQPSGIFEWARRLGMLGKTAVHKEVPGAAFALTNRQIGLLLSRMWAGDGHVNAADRNAYYATSSKRLALQVQHLLLRLGIIARVRCVQFPYRGGQKTGFQVFVTGNDNLRRFSRHVASRFLNAERRRMVAELILVTPACDPSKDVVPVAARGLVRAAKVRAGSTWAQVEVGANVSSRDFTPAGTNPHKIGFTRTTVGRLAEYFDDADLRRLAQGDILWDRVDLVELVGEMRTYDLEVPGTHNFVANDFVVHNSHSVAYSIIGYHTAWLKTHFPAEFMAALLSSQIGDTDSVVKYIAEARDMRLEVLPPDVNESGYKFTVIGERKIRFGLGAVRNVGHSAIDSVLTARGEKPFESLYDLCERVDLRVCNKRVFEALTLAGALDSLGAHRAQLFAGLDAAIREGSLHQDDKKTGQASLFGGPAEDEQSDVRAPRQLPAVTPWTESERLTREKEILGFYISGHPLDPFRAEAELFATHTVSNLGTWGPETMSLCVVVTAAKRQISKRTGAEFARLVIEDFSGSAEVMVFPEKWASLSTQLRTDVPVLLRGAYARRDQTADNPLFVVESVKPMTDLRADGQVAVALELTLGQHATPALANELRELISHHPGSAPIEIRWSDGNGERAAFRSRTFTISADGPSITDLRALVGSDRVKVVRASA